MFPCLEDIRLLTADQNNPNRTTLKAARANLEKPAKIWLDLPNTNQQRWRLLSMGRQRAEVCKQHGEFFAPVLRLPVSDVDRRMLRQILNKLKGKHNKELDNAEYIRILQQGEKEDLKALLESVGERLPKDLDDSEFSLTIPETYEIIVECKDEAHQKQIFEKLKSEGYKLRILTL